MHDALCILAQTKNVRTFYTIKSEHMSLLVMMMLCVSVYVCIIAFLCFVAHGWCECEKESAHMIAIHQNTRVVMGGGASEMLMSNAVDELVKTTPGKEVSLSLPLSLSR